jgi:hypothetical protein
MDNKYLLFLLLILVIKSHNAPSKFEDFLKNQRAMDLVNRYLAHNIRTINELLNELQTINVNISLRSLKSYISEIRVSLNINNKDSKYQKNIRLNVHCLSPSTKRIIYVILGADGNGKI